MVRWRGAIVCTEPKRCVHEAESVSVLARSGVVWCCVVWWCWVGSPWEAQQEDSKEWLLLDHNASQFYRRTTEYRTASEHVNQTLNPDCRGSPLNPVQRMHQHEPVGPAAIVKSECTKLRHTPQHYYKPEQADPKLV